MSQNTPLTDLVIGEIEKYLTGQGGGLLTGLLTVVEFVDSDGATCHLILAPADQPTPRSIGLTEYATELFRMQARAEFAAEFACGCDEDDD